MVCNDCRNPIDDVQGEWVDAIGIGCPGRGEWGEVLPHRPLYIEVASDTFQAVRYQDA